MEWVIIEWEFVWTLSKQLDMMLACASISMIVVENFRHGYLDDWLFGAKFQAVVNDSVVILALYCLDLGLHVAPWTSALTALALHWYNYASLALCRHSAIHILLVAAAAIGVCDMMRYYGCGLIVLVMALMVGQRTRGEAWTASTNLLAHLSGVEIGERIILIQAQVILRHLITCSLRVQVFSTGENLRSASWPDDLLLWWWTIFELCATFWSLIASWDRLDLSCWYLWLTCFVEELYLGCRW